MKKLSGIVKVPFFFVWLAGYCLFDYVKEKRAMQLNERNPYDWC